MTPRALVVGVSSIGALGAALVFVAGTGLHCHAADVGGARGVRLAPATSIALESELVPPVEPVETADPPVLATPSARFVSSFDVRAFMRGNVHVHTLLSDGDSSPAAVLAWYAQHDYRFVAITDHARRFDPRSVPAPPGLTVLAGEEITMTAGGAPVHVNGLCTTKTIGGGTFPRTAAALRWAVARIHDAGGIALVNHPNFRFALDGTTLEHMPQVELIEMHSAHPGVRSDGDAKHPSEEARWAALWQRMPAPFGVAVDDAHRFKRVSRAVPAPPGGAWIEVYGDDARPEALCEALREGHLYASGGARLRRLEVAGGTLSVWPDAPAAEVDFLGAADELLAHVTVHPGDGAEVARYTLRGGERTVRARIRVPGVGRAWTQPFLVHAPGAT